MTRHIRTRTSMVYVFIYVSFVLKTTRFSKNSSGAERGNHDILCLPVPPPPPPPPLSPVLSAAATDFLRLSVNESSDRLINSPISQQPAARGGAVTGVCSVRDATPV